MTVNLFQPHPGQIAILRHPARFKVVACGRRFGKTETGKILLVERALAGRIGWWISPTYRMADDVWRSLKASLAGVAIDKSESMRRLELPGGGVIRVRSGHDPDALRGSGLDLAVLDEAAYLHPDVWRAAIRPALADRRGEALFLSTPRGRNWFWSLWMHGQTAAHEQWKSWRFPTTANPLIDPAEVQAARDQLPERIFREEYLAEFLDDAGGVFRRVDEAATARPDDGPAPGERYVFGVDWARDADFTCIAVLAVGARRLVALDRFNEIGGACGRAAALARHWSPGDLGRGQQHRGPNIRRCSTGPAGHPLTRRPAAGAADRGAGLALERGELASCPIRPRRRAARLSPGTPALGTLPLRRAPGEHDDCVIALALAWYGASQAGTDQFHLGERTAP